MQAPTLAELRLAYKARKAAAALPRGVRAPKSRKTPPGLAASPRAHKFHRPSPVPAYAQPDGAFAVPEPVRAPKYAVAERVSNYTPYDENAPETDAVPWYEQGIVLSEPPYPPSIYDRMIRLPQTNIPKPLTITGDMRLRVARFNSEFVMLLELGSACVLANEMYDIVNVMQALCPTAVTTEDGALVSVFQEQDRLNDIYRTVQLLINPRLKATFDAWTRHMGIEPTVVIYTRKPKVVEYARRSRMHIEDGALVLRGGVRAENPPKKLPGMYTEPRAKYILDQVEPRTMKEHNTFEMLGLCGHAISEALEIKYTPIIIVTEERQSMDAAARLLNYPADHMYMYDAKASAQRAGDAEESHILQVPPFLYAHLGADSLGELREITRRSPIPADGSYDRYLSAYAVPPKGAKAYGAEDCPVLLSNRGRIVWNVGVAHMGVQDAADPEPWPIPTEVSLLGVLHKMSPHHAAEFERLYRSATQS